MVGLFVRVRKGSEVSMEVVGMVVPTKAHQRMSYPRLGFEGGQTPFYLAIPLEPYYKGHQ
jgi:hypothetical protein